MVVGFALVVDLKVSKFMVLCIVTTFGFLMAGGFTLVVVDVMVAHVSVVVFFVPLVFGE